MAHSVMINYTTNNKNRTNGNIRTRYEAQYTTNEKNTINGNITTRYEVQYTTNDKNTTMRKGGVVSGKDSERSGE